MLNTFRCLPKDHIAIFHAAVLVNFLKIIHADAEHITSLLLLLIL